MKQLSNASLVEHGVSNLDEASNVGTLDVVNELTFLTILSALFVNLEHDVLESAIDFFSLPAKSDGVLGHFET